MIELVPFAPRHVVFAARLEEICFSFPWSEAALAEEIENPDAYFIAAEEDGVFLGYAGMHTPCGDCYVDNIAVEPAARRRGVGEALVRGLIEHAQTIGGAFISLEVRPSNTAALHLYEKLGFSQAGRRKNFYTHPTEDGLILTKTLESAV